MMKACVAVVADSAATSSFSSLVECIFCVKGSKSSEGPEEDCTVQSALSSCGYGSTQMTESLYKKCAFSVVFVLVVKSLFESRPLVVSKRLERERPSERGL